jgi:hypothetical protein
MNPADKLARLASVVRLVQGSQSFEDYSKTLTEHFHSISTDWKSRNADTALQSR